MSDVNRIDVGNVNFQAGSGVNNNTKTEKNPSEDKKLKDSTKKMLGAAALASVVIAGIVVHKTIQKKNLKKSIVELKDKITKIPENNKSLYQDYDQYFDGSLLQDHIKEAEKLPIKQQYEKLNDIFIHSNITPKSLVQKETLVEYMQNLTLPKAILDTKDPYIIGKEYYRIMNERTFRSCVSGKTVQETVDNLFGKNSSVEPHNYDLSKEPNCILTQATHSGFKLYAALKGGNYSYVTNVGSKGINGGIISSSYPSALAPKAGEKFAISRTEDGVLMHVDEYNEGGYRRNAYSFVIPNVGSKLTPMQKDLLLIRDKITPEDLETFYRLFYGFDPIKRETQWLGQQTNYDAIASVIQTIAKRS